MQFLQRSAPFSHRCSRSLLVRSVYFRDRSCLIFRPVVHLYQGLRYRMWYLLGTAVIAGNTEVIGWGARLWSHYAPKNLTPYLIQ